MRKYTPHSKLSLTEAAAPKPSLDNEYIGGYSGNGFAMTAIEVIRKPAADA